MTIDGGRSRTRVGIGRARARHVQTTVPELSLEPAPLDRLEVTVRNLIAERVKCARSLGQTNTIDECQVSSCIHDHLAVSGCPGLTAGGQPRDPVGPQHLPWQPTCPVVFYVSRITMTR